MHIVLIQSMYLSKMEHHALPQVIVDEKSKTNVCVHTIWAMKILFCRRCDCASIYQQSFNDDNDDDIPFNVSLAHSRFLCTWNLSCCIAVVCRVLQFFRFGAIVLLTDLHRLNFHNKHPKMSIPRFYLFYFIVGLLFFYSQ